MPVPTRIGFIALTAVLASTTSIACGTSDAPPANEEESAAASTDPVTVAASAATKKAIGVSAWGVDSTAGGETVVHGYDADSKAVVEFRHKVAFGEGAYQVITTVARNGKPSATVMVDVEQTNGGVSAHPKMAVRSNTFAKDAAARSVVEHLSADVTKASEAPAGGTLVRAFGGGIATQALHPQSANLIECLKSLLDTCKQVCLTACSCILLTPLKAAASIASNVSNPSGGACNKWPCEPGSPDLGDAAQSSSGSSGSSNSDAGGDCGSGIASSIDAAVNTLSCFLGGGDSSDEKGGEKGGEKDQTAAAAATGDGSACKTTGSSFTLPVPVGKTVVVTQGNNGVFSHNNDFSRHAFDLGLDRGAPLTAMADGTVVQVRDAVKTGMDCYSGGGFECIDKANYVLVRHAGGDALYLHLETASVKVGQTVKRGDVVGTVGSTGQSSGPHAHVQLQQPCDTYVCKTIPLAFADVASPGVPASGDPVTATACSK